MKSIHGNNLPQTQKPSISNNFLLLSNPNYSRQPNQKMGLKGRSCGKANEELISRDTHK
ncbi:MAG: hypothetical protein ACLFQS_08375 [Bacteroidales bacterium]